MLTALFVAVTLTAHIVFGIGMGAVTKRLFNRWPGVVAVTSIWTRRCATRGEGSVFGTWTKWLLSLKLETHTLYLACRHPLTPWYAKVLAICVVAYALSPIDLIPDPIPVVGHLDDLILVPLGVIAVRWLVPSSVLAECRTMAEQHAGKSINTPAKWIAASIIIGVWMVAVAFLVRVVCSIAKG